MALTGKGDHFPVLVCVFGPFLLEAGNTTGQSPMVSSFQRHVTWDSQAGEVSVCFCREPAADFSAHLATLASPESKRARPGEQCGLEGGTESRPG